MIRALLSAFMLVGLSTTSFAQTETLELESCFDSQDRHILYRVPGTDWLFHKDEFKAKNSIFDEETKAAMKQVIRTLNKQGTEVIMVALPPRGASPMSVQGEVLKGFDRRVSVEEFQRKFRNAQEDLGQVGMHVLDLASLAWDENGLGDDFFYKQDHHWQPATRDAVAALLSLEVAAQGIDLPAPGNLSFQRGETFNFTKEGTRATRADKYCDFNVIDETVEDFRVETVAQDQALGLFGDPAPASDEEIGPGPVLVGTSNSGLFDAALHFSMALDSKVDDWSVIGGGPQASLENYLLFRDPDAPAPPLLIWEIAADSEMLLGRTGPQLRGAQRQGCRNGWHVYEELSLKAGEWSYVFLDGGSVDLLAFRLDNIEAETIEVGVEQGALDSRYRLDRPEKRLPTGRKGKPWFLSTEFSETPYPTKLRVKVPKVSTGMKLYACSDA